MTRTHDDVQLLLDKPAEGIAAIPHLLSFVPSESLVVMWLDASGFLIVTQRVDLPESFSDSAVGQWWNIVAGHQAALTADSALAVVVSSDKHLAERVGTEVNKRLEQPRCRGIALTDFTEWKILGAASYQPLTAEVYSTVAAVFGVTMATRPAMSRQAVEEEFAAVNPVALELVEKVAEGQASGDLGDDEKYRWREAVIENAGSKALAGHRLTDKEMAEMLVALRYSDTRDAFYIAIALAGLQVGASPADFTALVRRSPTGWRAPVATAAGLFLYLRGDGARAQMALTVAEEDAGHYPLAALMSEAIARGISPAAMTEAFTDSMGTGHSEEK